MKKLFILCYFFITLGIYAQGYNHYSIEQGLPANRTYKILQDNEGFIWIATDKGLSKFDGETFKNLTIASGLPSNDIWDIILTKDNKLWYFTRSNQIGYIINDTIYKFRTTKNELLYPNNISANREEVIFNSFNGNYKLNNGYWQKISNVSDKKSKASFFSILHHKAHYVVRELFNKPQQQQTIHIKDINKNNLLSFEIKARDRSEIKYKGQINDSLIVFQKPNAIIFVNLNNLKKYTIVDSSLFKKNNFIRIIATDNDVQISGQNFWAQLSHDYKLHNLIFFPKEISITTVYKDHYGNYWGTTNANGIYFFPKNSLSSKTYLKNKPVQFMKLIQNKLFAGILNEGIYKYNEKRNEFLPLFKDRDFFYDIFYLDDDNFAVFANTSTFVKKKGKLTTYFRAGQKILPYHSMFLLTNSKYISLFDQNLQFIKNYPIEGANSLCQYKNGFVAGTPLGLFKVTNDSISKVEILNKSVLPILSLQTINQSLLIGTDGFGAYLWQNGQKFIFIPETKDLIVHDIFIDNNDVWLATQKGVLNFRYKPNEKLLEFHEILRKPDGLISDHVDHVVIKDNKVFSSNYSGIAAVDKKEKNIFPPPKIYFKSIKYGSKSLLSNHEVFYNKNNNLTVNFGLIDYSGQEHNQTYYQLLPLQKDWQNANVKSINFNSLPPGDYTFKVKAVNSYLQNNIKEFGFSILPLWWQTTWAKALFVFIFLASIFFIGLYTRRKELKKQRDKLMAQKQMAEFELHALRSQMNPHFVFNSLNAIQYYINDENYDKSETYLVKFSRLIRMIFEFSRKKTISLRQEIDLLTSYLNLEKMRFGDRFNFCFNIDPKLNIDHIEIPTLLLQPIVENAVNHGIFHKKSKGTICLDFKYIDPQTFEVTIKDDGVGIEKSKQINLQSLKKHRSRSTEILKDRIKLLNLSEKWQITYNLQDNTNNNQTTYNTIVKLKIKKL
jgi:anti-sigma regulatory factor (Ser/Thr protein kinase)